MNRDNIKTELFIFQGNDDTIKTPDKYRIFDEVSDIGCSIANTYEIHQ